MTTPNQVLTRVRIPSVINSKQIYATPFFWSRIHFCLIRDVKKPKLPSGKRIREPPITFKNWISQGQLHKVEKQRSCVCGHYRNFFVPSTSDRFPVRILYFQAMTILIFDEFPSWLLLFPFDWGYLMNNPKSTPLKNSFIKIQLFNKNLTFA